MGREATWLQSIISLACLRIFHDLKAVMGAAAATLGGIFGGNQRDEELFGARRGPGLMPHR